MAFSVSDADSPAADYDLDIHDGEVTTVFRLRDSGIRLVGDGIEWRIDGEARRARLSDILRIRLTSKTETARRAMGVTSCQIGLRRGGAVTVFGGDASSPDAADRLSRYEAFVADLHRRLGPRDRARIRFTAGYGGARFTLLLVAAVLSALLWGTAALVMLLGLAPLRIGSVIGLSGGAVMTYGLFRLLHLNAPHIYDPSDPIGSATAGSIGDTMSQAIGDIRRGMTVARGVITGVIGAAVIMIIVVIVASHERVSLFEPGRAQLAIDAILARTGSHPTVTYVAVEPGEVLVEAPRNRDSSSRVDWRASRRTLFGWSEWDDVSGPTDRYPMSMSEDLGEETFKLERDDAAHLDDLAKEAVARAALGPGAAVTLMTLIAPHGFAERAPPPRWTIDVVGPGGSARLYANRTGTLFPPTPEPAGPPRIVLTAIPGSPYGLFPANAGTWVRIIDPDQSVRYDATLKVGDSYRVPDIPGIRLQTGKPDTLEVTVDGRPGRLPRGGYAGRLDTVLDPQSLLAAAQGQK
ncbi:MAG: DUF4115 domain-containing protein [Reyranellaceae bacterium]